MKRIYESILKQHLLHDRQMVFLAGPRQVGKTTISKTTSALTEQFVYLNWDYQDDQHLILSGPNKLVEEYQLDIPRKDKAILILDGLHKYKNWRNYLKGFYDKHYETVRFIITGSAKLDVFRPTGDSMMGRYFPYRVHPLSVRELVTVEREEVEISTPVKLQKDLFDVLIKFGGFPEPLAKQNAAFYRRWIKLRMEQLFNIDIRDLTRIHEIVQMKLLAAILKNQVGELVTYSKLSQFSQVSIDTVKSWVDTLESFYYCFKVSPWHKNIVRSLIKQPKIYLWNWADVDDIGARHENFVASHLLKAIHFWEDRGLGQYGLSYLRDKEKREVDFVVTKNGKPWFLVEVKSSHKHSISEHLYYFQKQTQAEHAFQVAFDLPHKDINCFDYTKPVIVPAVTFLSQLV
ncbi:MAG: ATP-binding protein [Gammaproteobacteria bacterium]